MVRRGLVLAKHQAGLGLGRERWSSQVHRHGMQSPGRRASVRCLGWDNLERTADEVSGRAFASGPAPIFPTPATVLLNSPHWLSTNLDLS